MGPPLTAYVSTDVHGGSSPTGACGYAPVPANVTVRDSAGPRGSRLTLFHLASHPRHVADLSSS